MLKRRIATVASTAALAVAAVAAVAATAAAVAATGVTAATAATATAPAVPRGLLPMSTSWVTARNGIVLAYPSRTTGARPYLLQTGDGGRTWRSLPAPPVRYPADNDQPDATWADGVIAVTDGTHIVATRDAGRHWFAVRIAGVSGSYFVGKIVIADGRIFALVTTQGASPNAAVYSGPVKTGVLRPVRGLSISGGIAYGDITAVGGVLQVDLGADYTTEKYWYSRNGVRFVSAALPCPDTTSALLAGVRQGKVVALCSGSPSDVGPGENDKQVWIAARLGGKFSSSGPVFISPNPQGFAAASARDMTVATTFYLQVTFNAGKTWATKLPQQNGAFWTDLAFPGATTGVAVLSTVNNAGDQVAAVYRTTDAGRTWHALNIP